MKFIRYIMLLFTTCAVVLGSGGRFDKKDEDKYQLIVFGEISDLSLVVLAGDRVATEVDLIKQQEESKERDKQSKEGKVLEADDTNYLTIVWVGKLKVDKVLKGDVKVGDQLSVTWTGKAMTQDIGLKGIPGSVIGRTDCESQVYKGGRYVFGLNTNAKHSHAYDLPNVWSLEEGDPAIYEGEKNNGNDPLSPEGLKNEERSLLFKKAAESLEVNE